MLSDRQFVRCAKCGCYRDVTEKGCILCALKSAAAEIKRSKP